MNEGPLKSEVYLLFYSKLFNLSVKYSINFIVLISVSQTLSCYVA